MVFEPPPKILSVCGLTEGLPSLKPEWGIYIHIPFCPHICPYCDFVKTNKFTKKMVENYFSKIKIQARDFIEKFVEFSQNLSPELTSDSHPPSKPAVTVYWGGGTPGLFGADYYAPLMDLFRSQFDLVEVTLETNPWTNVQTLFEGYQAIGINRLTLGAQSLCKNTLKVLGRRHTPEDVLSNLKWAQKSGFLNIQVDLIYGLDPTVRRVAVKDEVLRLVDAGATGISAYALTIEPRTLFASQSALVHEDNARREYDEILETCTSLGLRQFETSNFAFTEPLHNQVYWYGKPYLGLGTGAHGLLPPTPEWPYGRRYKVGQPLKTLAPGNDDLSALKEGLGSAEAESLFEMIFEPPRTHKDFVVETLFTRLRTEEGLSLQWFEDVLNLKDLLTILTSNAKISRAFSEGHLVMDTHLRFTPQGKVLGDAWVVDLLGVLEEKGFLHD